MLHQCCTNVAPKLLHQDFLAIFVVDINFSDMAKGNTTFGFMLANHPNRFGFYPIMLRITRDRVTRRVKTGGEVKKADWNQQAQNHKQRVKKRRCSLIREHHSEGEDW